MYCDFCKNKIKASSERVGRTQTGGLKEIISTSPPIPFTCNYCGGSFCEAHRLPEAHECKNLKYVREGKKPPIKPPRSPPDDKTTREKEQLVPKSLLEKMFGKTGIKIRYRLNKIKR